MIPRDGGSGSTHSSAKPTRSISAPSLSTPTRHPVRRGYSRSPLPTLSSSQRADRTRTAGRRSAIAARENRKSLSQPGLSSSQRADRTRTAGRRSAFAARENWKSLHPQKPQAELLKGAAIGVSVASRQSSRSHSSTHSSSSSPLPTTWAERERLLGRVDKPMRNPELQRAKGKIMDNHWSEFYKTSPDFRTVVTQPTWRDPTTGKMMPFPGAQYRRPDILVETKDRRVFSQENKATPLAAESSGARVQIDRDMAAQKVRAVLGKGDGPYLKVDHVVTKDSLRILGPGGNTALPGEIQKHVIIKPRVGLGVGEGVAEGTAKGVAKVALRGVSRAAMPIAAAVDAYDLTKTYQNGGNTPEFRSKAAGVAGGWATAVAGAEGGAALGAAVGSFFFPVGGTAAGVVVGGLIGGAGGYFVGSGAASKLEEGVEKVAPKVWDGAKSAWHSVFG
jgi:hypothetical protein